MNILITGGASGLGAVITKSLCENSENRIYFTYSNSADNARALENSFKNVTAIKCDFKNHTEVYSLTEKIKEIDLDVLINNAFSGEPVKTYFHKIPSEEFAAEFVTNIIPTIEIVQSALNIFRKKKKGKIITILTSFLTNTPPIGASVYVAEKAYLASLVKSWATENIKFNISSNSISPSFMQTNLTANVDERVIEQIKDNHPLKQILPAEEVVKAVSYLIDASAQTNGLDILINAGTNIK